MEGRTSSPPLLSVENVAFFEGLGLVKPVVNGKRKVSTALLSPPSSVVSRSSSEASSSTRISSLSFETTFERHQAEDVELPARLYSVETYVCLGFTQEMAETLWARYLAYYDEDETSFFDYAKYHVTNPERDDVEAEGDDWVGLMSSIGVNQRLQTAIMLPEFKDVRHTATCKFWVLDSMKAMYLALEMLNNDLRMEMARRQHIKKVPKIGRQKAVSISSTPMLPSPKSRKSGGPELEEEGAKHHEAGPTVATIAPTAPAAMENHVMLWRGGDHVRNVQMYDEGTGEIDLTAIHSAPGDFSGANPVPYFSPQRKTADRYASYSKHRIGVAKVSIVQIAVPYSLMNRLSVHELRCPPKLEIPKKGESAKQPPPISDWQKVIWWSRRGKLLPKDLHWIAQKDVLIGECARSMNEKYVAMKGPEEISWKNLMTVQIDGEETWSLQWVVQSYDARLSFQEACQGKVWLHHAGALQVPDAAK